MYEAYWNLESKPFESTNDTKFYYPSETHQGALLKLRYAVENRRGAALLTGQAGLGKTLLVHSLNNLLEESFAPRIHLVFPQMPAEQLLAYLADELTEETGTQLDVATNVRRIERALADNVDAGRHAVVVIDEAHVLHSQQSLETLRLLLNFEYDAQAGMTVLVVGQPALLPVLDRKPELDERLAVKCLLRRFTTEETISYVTHRLRGAGGSESIFDEAALEAIHRHANGIPRRINRLCDLSLLIGFAEERDAITQAQIDSVHGELVTVAPD